ncbi:hypothetical protein ETAA8_70390 [Anatilimnocola aggregata]|uniref:Uncharacterized protein n=1 Tax=Anatilimnocola aggregata TaxID=2528021 RepID=A0A517YNS9_9BACT|nr:hypothetical protein [Anatilimnocola aggregata]QDU31878.1 hypothetical protein ETAA8_70390 [Anatilimnocola aggregata]
MRKIVISGLIVLAGVVISAIHGVEAQGQDDSPSALEKSAKGLDEWLGIDANGKKWSDYLLLKPLLAEISGDDEVDLQVLANVWRRFTSGEAGLEGERFQAVRKDLEAFLNKQLEQSRSQVAAAAKAADEGYAAPGADAVTKAQAEVKTAAAELNTALLTLPRARAAAEGYFGKQTLTDLAAGTDLSVEQLDALTSKLGKYRWRVYDKQYVDVVPGLKYRNEEEVGGFGGQTYGKLRTALVRLRNARALADDADGKGTYQATAKALAENLAAANKLVGANPKPVAIDIETQTPLPLPAIAQAAAALKKLQTRGEATELSETAVAGYKFPNLVAFASSQFLASGLDQKLDRVTPVNDNILGTSINGTARLLGQTNLKMLTNPEQAGYSVVLSGVANSNSVGYNGPVTIHSTGVTNLHGEKRIHFDDEIGGMRPSPATATAATSTSVNGIGARGPLVEKIAWKRVMESKGQAEAIASQHAADRLRAQMDSEALTTTSKLNKNFEEKYRKPLIIRNEYPREFVTQSSTGLLQVVISQLGLGQLGSPDVPPTAPETDVAVQVHESYVANFARAMLGGQEYTSLELRQMQEDMGGKVKSLEELAKERTAEGEEPNIPETVQRLADTIITFDEEMPVRVEFRGDHVLIVIRTKKLETRKLNDDPAAPEERDFVVGRLEITTLYKLEKDGDNYALVRVGPSASAYLDLPKGQRPSPKESTGKRRIDKRFSEDVFADEKIALGPLDFKKRAGTAKGFGNWAEMPPLPATDARSSSGWFSIGWSMPAAEKKVATK